MSNSPKALRPQTSQAASERPRPLTAQESLRQSLLQHLRKLVEVDPERALEMSVEYVPELFLSAQTQPVKYWADALMNSDSMQILLSRSPNQAQILLQQPDLQSLLELMP